MGKENSANTVRHKMNYGGRNDTYHGLRLEKNIMSSSGDMPVGPVLFEKGRGGHSKKTDFQ